MAARSTPGRADASERRAPRRATSRHFAYHALLIALGLPACSTPCVPLLSADVLPGVEQKRLEDAERWLGYGLAEIALAEFRALIEDHPDHFRALRGEQEALLRLGRGAEAMQIVARRRANRDDAASALLEARLESDPLREADAIDRALARAPDHPYALLALASTALRRGDYATAEPLLDRSLGSCAPPPESRLARARVRAATGKFDGAASDYRDYLEERPRDLAARHELASLLHRELERRDDALDQYRAMLEIDPRSPEAIVGVAVIATERGDFAEAERLYRSIETVEPVALLNLGLLYRDELARDREALECFRGYLDFAGDRAMTRSVTDRLFVVPGYVKELEDRLTGQFGVRTPEKAGPR